MIRLVRKPSLWMNFLGRFAFGVVWAGAFIALSIFSWFRRAGTPIFVFILLGFFDLFAIAVVWDLVVRFWRTLTDKQPIVEIDKPSLTYGETAQLRVAEPHPESVAELNVHLVAEHWLTTQDQPNVTVRSYQACYDEELMRMNVVAGEQVSRMLQIRIPETPPAEDARWKIVVTTALRQGGLIQHPFPIVVEPRR
jgi:hypothetical protein